MSCKYSRRSRTRRQPGQESVSIRVHLWLKTHFFSCSLENHRSTPMNAGFSNAQPGPVSVLSVSICVHLWFKTHFFSCSLENSFLQSLVHQIRMQPVGFEQIAVAAIDVDELVLQRERVQPALHPALERQRLDLHPQPA